MLVYDFDLVLYQNSKNVFFILALLRAFFRQIDQKNFCTLFLVSYKFFLTKERVWTFLKSPSRHKKSREQFGCKVYTFYVSFSFCSAKHFGWISCFIFYKTCFSVVFKFSQMLPFELCCCFMLKFVENIHIGSL